MAGLDSQSGGMSMFNEKNLTRGVRSWLFKREGSELGSHPRELVETERVFESVDDMVEWTQTLANIKLRDRLVWFAISSFSVEMLLVFLHSASVIQLPEAVLIAVSVLMGGSGFGLGSLLFYIAKNLFR